jgi:hypothetical protein
VIIRPYLIARYGVIAAMAMAGLSAFWAHSAGYSLDAALMRSVFVFVIFVALAFGAEAVLISGPIATRQQPAPHPHPEPESTPETEDE